MKKNMFAVSGMFMFSVLVGCTETEVVSSNLEYNSVSTTINKISLEQKEETQKPKVYTQAQVLELQDYIWDSLITTNPYQFFAPFYQKVEMKNNAKDVYVTMTSTYDEFTSRLDTTMDYQYRISSDRRVMTRDFWEEQAFTNPKNRTDFEKFLALIPTHLLTISTRFENIHFILENPNTQRIQSLNINREQINELIANASDKSVIEDFDIKDLKEFFVYNEDNRAEYLKRFYKEEEL